MIGLPTVVGFFLKNWRYLAIAIAVIGVLLFVRSWEKRGKEIEDLKSAIKSKESVIQLVTMKQQRETEITNETDKRIDELDETYGQDTSPMAPPIRAAIDSLY